MRGWKYLPSLLPSVLVVIGNLMGGWWSALNTFYVLVILVLVDYLAPRTHQSNRIDDSTIPDFILLLSVASHTAAITTLFYGIYTGILSNGFVILAAISTGLNSGVNGITVAHELIHRKQKFWRTLGIWNLILVNYSHFYIEHIRGHHARVGTPEDPATARKGENIYQFFIRTVPGQFKSALQLETQKQQRRQHPGYGLNNYVIRFALLQLVVLILLLVAGWQYFLVHAIQSIVGIFLLETANYGEHYGLERTPGQRVAVHHSWQSDVLSTRLTLVELSRHTDHHLKASKPYHQLDSHAEGKFMPHGYFGMFYPMMIPPLWFKWVDPLLENEPTNNQAPQTSGSNRKARTSY